MKDIVEVIEHWRSDGERIALATVIRVDGSAPRDEGATMGMTASGKIIGSVSGGCVENAVVEEAQTALAGGPPKIVRYGINKNMMWDVGLSCGGAIDVFIATLVPDAPLPDVSRLVAWSTVVRGPNCVGSTRAVYADRPSAGGSGSASLDAGIDAAARGALGRATASTTMVGEHEVFIAALAPDPRLVIVGAVHIAVALCDLAAKAGFTVTVIDPREKLNNRERFPAATALRLGWPEDELPALQLDENAYVAVLTHDEKFDDPTLAFVLRHPVRYVGAIGSRKTQALRRDRLAAAGFSPAQIDAVHAPIGLDIGAQSPEEIAVAILAEIIAAKHDRSGMKLKDRSETHIHV
jgi:xanthine dehydrogenase accessory factor